MGRQERAAKGQLEGAGRVGSGRWRASSCQGAATCLKAPCRWARPRLCHCQQLLGAQGLHPAHRMGQTTTRSRHRVCSCSFCQVAQKAAGDSSAPCQLGKQQACQPLWRQCLALWHATWPPAARVQGWVVRAAAVGSTTVTSAARTRHTGCGGQGHAAKRISPTSAHHAGCERPPDPCRPSGACSATG